MIMGKKVFVDLSHPFSAESPRWPYFEKANVTSAHTIAKSGVLTQWINVPQHTGTHCDAPRHVMEYEFDGRRARYTHEMPIDAYTGEAVCLKIEVEPWALILPKDLEAGCEKAGINPGELAGMVLVLDTGMHKYYDDSKAYYHYACGTGVEVGRWIVKHKLKCVAMDGQALDHPLHTAMGLNGGTQLNLIGHTGQTLVNEYKQLFGEEAYAEFDKFEYINMHGQEAYDTRYGDLEAVSGWGTWEPCHKLMLGNGIVGVENLGGDLAKVSGKRFKFYCFPMRWYMGDGSMARCIAEIDEDQMNQVPAREYFYAGTGYADEAHGGANGLKYIQSLFNRNK
jgi:kynurenine formamidase